MQSLVWLWLVASYHHNTSRQPQGSIILVLRFVSKEANIFFVALLGHHVPQLNTLNIKVILDVLHAKGAVSHGIVDVL